MVVVNAVLFYNDYYWYISLKKIMLILQRTGNHLSIGKANKLKVMKRIR